MQGVRGSNPLSSTKAAGEVRPRKARTSSPSSFLLGFASRGGGVATRTPLAVGVAGEVAPPVRGLVALGVGWPGSFAVSADVVPLASECG